MSDQTDYEQPTTSNSSEGVMSTSYYGGDQQAVSDDKARRKADKPTHYKVICISMYTKDLKQLDDMVDALKARGMTKANRSALIRYALSSVDLENVPQGI